MEYKDSLPFHLTSSISNARVVTYITLGIAEHIGLSTHTGRSISSPFSSVRSHSGHLNNSFCSSDFKILHRTKHDLGLSVLEPLYAELLSPEYIYIYILPSPYFPIRRDSI